MFRALNGTGLGNLFIWISQLTDEPVSDVILGSYRGKYLRFKNLNIVPDDPSVPDSERPPILINPYFTNNIHPRIRDKLEPTPLMYQLLADHRHLIEGVTCGMAIRTNRLAHESHVPKISQQALSKFENIISQVGPVFLACDDLDLKKELAAKYPDVRYVDQPFVLTYNENTSDISTPYLEFFLLAQCPYLFLTGGNTDFSSFSTYGYMAAVYGGMPNQIIWN
jgi:hypothetical protein